MLGRFRVIFVVLAALILGGLATPASATTAIFFPREELVQMSATIARVTVGKAVTSESDDRTAIVTRTEVEVKQFLKGSGQTKFVVEQIGGTYNGKTQRLLGDAYLRPGEDAVVFLVFGDQGRMNYAALSLSVYHVDEKGIARRDLGGLTLVKRSDGQFKQIAPQEIAEPVEQLMTDIVRLVGGK
jgi:hypothetical protein